MDNWMTSQAEDTSVNVTKCSVVCFDSRRSTASLAQAYTGASFKTLVKAFAVIPRVRFLNSLNYQAIITISSNSPLIGTIIDSQELLFYAL